MDTTESIARYYGDERFFEYRDEDGFGLVSLCRPCARETGLQHAEPPATWEELECFRCGIKNEQAATWEREMAEHESEVRG